jgi:Tfp pilus assembly protein PilX
MAEPDSTDTDSGSYDEARNDAGDQPKAAKSGSMLRYVLYILFGVTALGLGYDQLARHEARTACEVVELAIQNQSPESRLKSDEVRRLLERQPDDTLSEEESVREIYRWRGTLLTYDLTVEYSKEGDLRDVRMGSQ